MGWDSGNRDPGALVEEEKVVQNCSSSLTGPPASNDPGCHPPHPPAEPENSGEFAAAARTLPR